jgi:hypothetical protein
LQFRNAVDLADPAALRLTPVDYLVLHLDLRHELGAARAPSAAPSGDFQRSIVPGCLPRLIAAFGQPLTQDADIVVWRLRPQSQPQRAPVAAQP